jgi:hypothetical protein
MNKLFIAIALTLTANAFTAEGVRQNPLTEQEKALVAEIKDLRGQLHQKHEALLALLEKDHPKLAAMIRHRHAMMLKYREGLRADQPNRHPRKGSE